MYTALYPQEISLSQHNDLMSFSAKTQGLRQSNHLSVCSVYCSVYTKFKCSVDHAKCSLFRVANGIFAKVGRLVSEEVILELLKCKCLPVLLYGL